MPKQSLIVSERGEPYMLPKASGGPMLLEKSFFNALNTYFQSLTNTRMPALFRAKDPFVNHAWIFASAMVIATTASQAPFTVFVEEDDETDKRRLRAERAGIKNWRPGLGSKRQAHRNWSNKSVASRVFKRGMEELTEHPLTFLVDKPNPFQSGVQLQQFTDLWLAVRGEVFWVMTGPGASVLNVNEMPAEIWPMSPDSFEPVYEGGADRGILIGWRVEIPNWFPQSSQQRFIQFTLDEVIQFKFPNPMDMVRGMSRLTPVAGNVEIDMLINSMNRAILENRGVPRGILEFDGELSQDETKEAKTKWKEEYEGADNAGRLAVLSGGFKYNPVALTPEQMQHLSTLKWDRETELAVMGTPPSVLGVTEFTNYATQLGQDNNFWDKNLLPMLRMKESAINSSHMFWNIPDTVFGLYDVSNVEALRAGLTEKVKSAVDLCKTELHMTPEAAFTVVGLEVPDYLGIDAAIISGFASPVQDILAPSEDADGSPSSDPLRNSPSLASEDGSQDVVPVERKRGGKRWKQFRDLQEREEVPFKKAWRSWVNQERKATLKRFDEAASREAQTLSKVPVVTRQLDLTAVLGSLSDSQQALAAKVRPLYGKMYEDVWEFTVDSGEIGIPVFSIDDPTLVRIFEDSQTQFTTIAPTTLRRQLTASLAEGVTKGETLNQLRLRVSQTYGLAAGSAKTLQIARTETAGFLNNMRTGMFKRQGFEFHEWVTAGDVGVRPSHVTYGVDGVQEIGFNYMTLTGRTDGILESPHDPRAPADEVINCRCTTVPATRP